MPTLQCKLSTETKQSETVKLTLWLQHCVYLLTQDGWVGFRAVVLKKRLTAADFYNGYLHHRTESLFVSQKQTVAHPARENSVLWCKYSYIFKINLIFNLNFSEQCNNKMQWFANIMNIFYCQLNRSHISHNQTEFWNFGCSYNINCGKYFILVCFKTTECTVYLLYQCIYSV